MIEDTLLLNALRDITGPQGLITEPADMQAYVVDWWGHYRGDALAVARPNSTEQVAAIVRLCAANDIAIVPQGGNTGLCGGATPQAGLRGVVVVLDRMNQVRGIDADNHTITVDAGCTLAAVQAVADGVDQLFPLSLGSEGTCQIGGNISTNAGGTAVLRYGNMRDLVLGLEAVLPDGQIWHGLRGLRKDNTGYDLKQFFIGAEGTLGIITGAVLKLFPKPRASATAWVGLDHLEYAVRLLSVMRAHCGERITSFELTSRSQLDLVYKHIPDTRDPLDGTHPWVVMIELGDMSGDAQLQELLEQALSAAFEQGLASDAAIAASESQAAAIWHIRHSVSEANVREGKSVSHDISVPLSHIAGFIENVQNTLGDLRQDAHVLTVGHAGDGNLHFILVFPHDVWRAWAPEVQRARAAAITKIVQRCALDVGGSISAEHGIGVSHREELKEAKAPLELALMRSIKQAIDPKQLMNPGKLL